MRKSRAEVPHEETRKEFFKRQYNKVIYQYIYILYIRVCARASDDMHVYVTRIIIESNYNDNNDIQL